jgi:hypothetical protein
MATSITAVPDSHSGRIGGIREIVCLYGSDADRDELAVTGMQEAAPRTRRLPEDVTRETNPDQVSLEVVDGAVRQPRRAGNFQLKRGKVI